MRRIFLAILLLAATSCLYAQQVSTFEMRYLTNDTKADGVTDFHGENEWLNTDQRVKVLGRYADFASKFWGDPELDTPLFTDAQVTERVAGIKPLPLTSVRHTVRLADWKAVGYKQGLETLAAESRKSWTAGGAVVSDGCLLIQDVQVSPVIDTICWRFSMKMELKKKAPGLVVKLLDENGSSLDIKDFASVSGNVAHSSAKCNL